MKTSIIIPVDNSKPVEEVNLNVDNDYDTLKTEVGLLLNSYSNSISSNSNSTFIVNKSDSLLTSTIVHQCADLDIVDEVTPVGRIYYQKGNKKNYRANLLFKDKFITGNMILIRR